MAIISSGISFIDRNHHETTFSCINIFRWTIFHFVAVGRRRGMQTQKIGLLKHTTKTAAVATREKKKNKKDKRFINQLKW